MGIRIHGLESIARTIESVGDYTSIFISKTYSAVTFTMNASSITYSGILTVDWGDGTVDTNLSHTYSEGWADYNIKLRGNITRIGSSFISDRYLVKKIFFNSPVQMSLGSNIIEYCSNLDTIIVGRNVTTVDSSTFEDCHASIINFLCSNCTLYNCSYLLKDCTHLVSVRLPNGCRYIPQQCFYNCADLSEVTLQEGIEVIDRYAFARCSQIKNLQFPKTLTTLQPYTFYSCSGLECLDFSKTQVENFPSIFTNMSSTFNEVRYPATTTQITPFTGCSIADIYVYATTPPGLSSTLQSCTNIHVPSSSLSAYQAVDNWNDSGTLIGDL